MRHEDQNAGESRFETVADGSTSATSKRLHPLRTKGRVLAAAVGAEAQAARCQAGDDACSDRAIALRLGLNKNVPASWFRPTSGVGIALGDVLALPRELAREILTRAFASLDEGGGPDEQATTANLTIALGKAVEALSEDFHDDGKVNQHARHAANFARIATIATRGYLAALRAGSTR